MNSVKILHAVRSAITATAELLVYQLFLFVFQTGHRTVPYNCQIDSTVDHCIVEQPIAETKIDALEITGPDPPNMPKIRTQPHPTRPDLCPTLWDLFLAQKWKII